MKKLNLAIIGQGRSGKDIHGKYYRSDANTLYNVKYVVELDDRRREVAKEIYPGCETFSDYRELFDKKDIDVVVNASYSEMHYPITLDLLAHKFNVLVEKPAARNRHECDEMAKVAKDNGVLLAVFQQTFFAPWYQKALEVIASGKLGKIYQISICYSNGSRRWDWQTLQKKMGGNAYNTGPHPIGTALGFLGFDKNTRIEFSKLAKTEKSFGDFDDYAKLILSAPDKFIVDIEINNTDCYPGPICKIQGDRGTFKTTGGEYEYKYILPEENEAHTVSDTFIHGEDKAPIYCSETLNWHEESGKYEGTVFSTGTAKLYENLYYALTEGKPLYVTQEMVREIVGTIEALHAKDYIEKKF